MTAIILSIGDELTLGQTIDTNSPWLSQQLARVGCQVRGHITIPDNQSLIESAIRSSAAQCDLLLITGGIGPTPDDLTRQALASVMNVPLELDDQWLAELHKFFAARNRPMPDMNLIQAMIPRGATMLFNQAGTAAGIHASIEVASPLRASVPSSLRASPLDIFVLPGVPKEMKLMFERSVLPIIQEKSSGGVILSKSLHTFGPGESTIAELLGPLMDRSRNPTVGTTVSNGIVSVRINARFSSQDEAQRHLDDTVKQCYTALGDLIFGEDDTTLPEAVAHLLRQSFDVSVATAESCTGGLLAKYFTDVPGSSRYYRQGWVTYTNDSKSSELGVPVALIDQHGAVSRETVSEMANRARNLTPSTYALAISGIAGPDGGTPTKPVGTVCIALSYQDDSGEGIHSRTFLFPGDREMIRDRAAKMALTMLRFHLLGKPLPF